MNEVVETIYQWHTGMKIHHISLSLGLDRKTVRKYLGMAQSLGVTREGPLPDEEILAGRLKNLLTEKGACYDKPAIHLIARHHDEIQTWLTDKDMTGKQVWRLLKEIHGIEVSYTTIKRYLRKEFAFGRPKVTIRMETSPGEEAQVDFGYMGLMYDPGMQKKRRTWAFIMTLSYSRHKFVRFVFRQDIDTWLDCHERAFAFFGRSPPKDYFRQSQVRGDKARHLRSHVEPGLCRHGTPLWVCGRSRPGENPKTQGEGRAGSTHRTQAPLSRKNLLRHP